ncbi:two component transcriptional regulator, winged helix family [Polaromonas sp. OV174]|uniref:response regulator n=1 Tax=Polaromonas sp. OV174 TaxID=1855300 RepID=UPI0008EEAA7F|nr:response regulator [Polaromonas sp. OV174]SFC30446.1 two component transcriptional regulator, winged helix family [Polaromonas sp. OV174]
MRILVVEDDAGIAVGLRANLQQRGYAADVCATLAAAWGALRSEAFDLVLLDLGLADGDGGDLLRRIRQPQRATGELPDPLMPVLIMTARDQVADRISGLNLGADDYLVKPFDLDELEARMRALLRRSAGRAHPLLVHGELVIDPGARSVLRAGQGVELTPREFALLLLLLASRGRVLSRQQLEARLYSWEDAVGSNAVEVHVHHLRRKLGEGLIQTLRGVGYFIPQEERS